MKSLFSSMAVGTAVALVLITTACNSGPGNTGTTSASSTGGTTTGSACVALGSDCSDAGCCTGSSCVSGQCTCAAHEGDICDDQTVCCSGLSCDGTNHCQLACAGDAGACRAIGDVCGTSSDCCSPGSCSSGVCQGLPVVACAADGTACGADTDCCGSVDAGSRYACIGIADGGSICHLGAAGETCSADAPCAPGTACIIATGTGTTGGTSGTTGDTGTSGTSTGGNGTSDTGSSGGTTTGGGDPSGVCGVEGTTPANCTLQSKSCNVWDLCNPASAANQNYDPCFYGVSGNQLYARTDVLTCHGGHCNYPMQGEPCTAKCTQTAGDPLATQCITFLDGSNRCLESCGSDNDCTGASVADTQNNNPPALTEYCVDYSPDAGSASGCQPELCYIEGQAGSDDPSVFYQPCAGRPNTVCLPQYFGGASSVLGFCQAVSTATNSVGTACSPAAGANSQAGLCGSDAICLGNVCQKVCDASQLGNAGTPACDSTETCISSQGVNLIAAYQVGGCGIPCDPLADEEHSGCTNFCGGPPSKCDWIIGDPVPNQIHGYCGAALVNPVADGQPCGASLVEPCGSGEFCLNNSTGTAAFCNKLCDPTVSAGDPDACPNGGTCNAFTGFTHAGYCS